MSQRATHAAEAELRQRLSEIPVSQEVGHLSLEAQDTKDVLDQVLQKITEACSFDLGAIRFPDSDGGRVSVASPGSMTKPMP